MKARLFLASLLFGLSATSVSAAMLEVHENELLKSCQALKNNPAATEGASCATYINGFLDGALLTDAQNALELNEVAQSNFMDRALRTRLGDRESPESFLHFCVPSDMAKADVIESVAAYLPKEGSANVNDLRGEVFEGLKTQFPC